MPITSTNEDSSPGGKETCMMCKPKIRTNSQWINWRQTYGNRDGRIREDGHQVVQFALMQAYAEGFSILKAKHDFNLDLYQVANIWRYGSAVRSWLLDLTANVLAGDQDLSGIEAWVKDSGEGR